jgi:hypothetical protein
MSSTWSSGIGKFPKRDPEHGKLWRWLKANWQGFWNASIRDCKHKCKCKKETQNEKNMEQN